MASLPRVSRALKEAKPRLQSARSIEDLAYLVDVNSSGADSLVVYIVVTNDTELSSAQKREVEDKLREALGRVSAYSAYFRWRTSDEQRAVLTMKGLVDRPVSALH